MLLLNLANKFKIIRFKMLTKQPKCDKEMLDFI